MKHYNIRITGYVQGVWFRDSTKRKALELDISGFVQNLPDGSVYIEAEGSEDALQKLTNWCRIGPERAEVKGVEIKEGEMVNFSGFEIRR